MQCLFRHPGPQGANGRDFLEGVGPEAGLQEMVGKMKCLDNGYSVEGVPGTKTIIQIPYRSPYKSQHMRKLQRPAFKLCRNSRGWEQNYSSVSEGGLWRWSPKDTWWQTSTLEKTRPVCKSSLPRTSVHNSHPGLAHISSLCWSGEELES